MRGHGKNLARTLFGVQVNYPLAASRFWLGGGAGRPARTRAAEGNQPVLACPGLGYRVFAPWSATALAADRTADRVRSRSPGPSHEEIRAIIHVVGIYCGVPQALECFRVARKVLEEG